MEVILCGVIFLYMGFCSFLCSRIAAGKNRGADEWFVCGEIFGLIAVIAVWLLPRLPDRQPNDRHT